MNRPPTGGEESYMNNTTGITRTGRAMLFERETVQKTKGGDAPLALAMAYVPMQCLKNVYGFERALSRGTLFPELDKPFTRAKGGCRYD